MIGLPCGETPKQVSRRCFGDLQTLEHNGKTDAKSAAYRNKHPERGSTCSESRTKLRSAQYCTIVELVVPVCRMWVGGQGDVFDVTAAGSPYCIAVGRATRLELQLGLETDKGARLEYQTGTKLGSMSY